ncbi:hypothetical protein T484DRAFT_1853693 [Baffinella frigidus]|nr:hypothetical protein T484DRAFT_1853693 [Cryptophyta sp. CCMP2293]
MLGGGWVWTSDDREHTRQMHLPGKRSLIFLGALAALLAPVSAFQGGPCLLQVSRGGLAGGAKVRGVGGEDGVLMMPGESGECTVKREKGGVLMMAGESGE